MNVNYRMTANGRDVSVLKAVIEARRRELGETTRQAATATAIQVLRSIRANTRIADPDAMNVKVTKSSGYTVGWKKEGGFSKRCIRLGSKTGPYVSQKSMIDLCGKYVKGETADVYSVVDVVEGSKERSVHYLVLAKDRKTAEEYAKYRHRRRVKRYSGMARYALTYAMMQTARNSSPDKANASVTSFGKGKAIENVTAVVRETGFDRGNVSIDIHDALRYATDALKDGEGYVQTAVQKACNGIVGMINNRIKKTGSFHTPLKVPFPKE